MLTNAQKIVKFLIFIIIFLFISFSNSMMASEVYYIGDWRISKDEGSFDRSASMEASIYTKSNRINTRHYMTISCLNSRLSVTLNIDTLTSERSEKENVKVQYRIDDGPIVDELWKIIYYDKYLENPKPANLLTSIVEAKKIAFRVHNTSPPTDFVLDLNGFLLAVGPVVELCAPRK